MKTIHETFIAGQEAFDKYQKELDEEIPELGKSGGMKRFGYKMNKEDWIFTVTDWDNIKAHNKQQAINLLESVVSELEELGMCNGVIYQRKGKNDYLEAIQDQIDKINEIINKIGNTD